MVSTPRHIITQPFFMERSVAVGVALYKTDCFLLPGWLFRTKLHFCLPVRRLRPAGYVFTNKVKEFSYNCKVGPEDQCSLRTRRPGRGKQYCDSGYSADFKLRKLAGECYCCSLLKITLCIATHGESGGSRVRC